MTGPEIYSLISRWRDAHRSVDAFTEAPFYGAWKAGMQEIAKGVGAKVPLFFASSPYEAEKLVIAGADPAHIIALAKLLDPEHFPDT